MNASHARLAALFACGLLSATAVSLAQERTVEFKLRPPEQKQRVLAEVAVAPALQEADLDVINAALDDATPGVRESALLAVARRSKTANVDAWRSERPVLLAMKPRIVSSLQDADAYVRLGAISALLGLELDRSQRPPSAAALHEDVAQALGARYAAETVDGVRAQIVNAFGWYDVPETMKSQRNDLVRAALSDPAPGVVQMAALAVGRKTIHQALPQLVNALGDPRAPVRTMVAQSIARFGAAARRYLPALQAALASETDDLAKKAIQGAIELVSR